MSNRGVSWSAWAGDKEDVPAVDDVDDEDLSVLSIMHITYRTETQGAFSHRTCRYLGIIKTIMLCGCLVFFLLSLLFLFTMGSLL